MNLQSRIEKAVKQAVKEKHGVALPTVEFQATRKDFEGDLTLVTFPMLRYIKANPVQLGEALGDYLVANVPEIARYNVVKGFLNLVIDDAFYLDFLNNIKDHTSYGLQSPDEDAPTVMVEYSSPNTNKPLHLGHIRNNLLGYSVAEILKAAGNKVVKTQIINDRGIHICKSMLAWQKFGNGETPENAEIKGDKLVGNYYVAFDKAYKEELKILEEKASEKLKEVILKQQEIGEYNLDEAIFENPESKKYFDILKRSLLDYVKYRDNTLEIDKSLLSGYGLIYSSYDWHQIKNKKALQKYKEEFIVNYRDWQDSDLEIENKSELSSLKFQEKIKSIVQKNSASFVEIQKEAEELLRKWEAGDPYTVSLWKTMNQWVYDGFEKTYNELGVDFDKNYYESDTYLLGKDVINEGLEKGVFYKKEDGSVWIDLTDEGLDEKIVLRADGTAVYMTQDIGTAIQRVKDFDIDGMVYTVGNEQDYHFKVLFLILKKLGYAWANHLYHLSYGMVDLPSGKMKSREGTVVDADDLMAQMVDTAAEISEELGKLEGYTTEEKHNLYRTVGLGALKYYILKVDPRKRILFNPEESVDFQGNTGPFIQYTYARIQSILRKGQGTGFSKEGVGELHPKEKALLKQLQLFPETVQQAAAQYSPALIANYVYELVKLYNSFYQSVPILAEFVNDKRNFRILLSKQVAQTIKNGFALLGIEVPERM